MFANDNDMVECPYNKTHRMLRKRLQSHLLKCRISYPDVELRKCPFNITHLIPEPEFAHHATNCPDRKLITQYKYDAPEQEEEECPKHAPIECDEDWDDTDVNDYNPRLYLDKANVIRRPDGVSRSERKLFIKKERRRLGDYGDDSDDETKDSISSLEKKLQPDNSYDNADEVHEKYLTARSYVKESPRNNRKRSTSPSTSSFSQGVLRSPAGLKRTYCVNSPVRTSSPDYLRNSPPTNSVGQTIYSYNSDLDYDTDSRIAKKFRTNSGRNHYNNNSNNTQILYDCNIETNSSMPPAPPPPIISYPTPRSRF